VRRREHFLRRAQRCAEDEWLAHRRFWEMAAAIGTVAAIVVMAAWHLAVFDEPPLHPASPPGVWDYFLGNRLVLGSVRLLLIGISVFLLASLVALGVAGRWASGLGKDGLRMDEIHDTEQRIKELEMTIDDLNRQIDNLREQKNSAYELAVRLAAMDPR
jgi:hypothetical protein